MKRILAIVLVGAILFGASGCALFGGGLISFGDSSIEMATATPSENKKVVIDNIENFKVDGAELGIISTFTTKAPTNGNIDVLCIQIAYKNTSEEEQSLYDILLLELYDNGVKNTKQSYTSETAIRQILGGDTVCTDSYTDILPEKAVIVPFCFEISRPDADFELHLNLNGVEAEPIKLDVKQQDETSNDDNA